MSELSTFGDNPLEIKRRPFQRSLNVIVRPSGCICVTANRTTSERRIHKFLLQNQQWLEKVLLEYELLRARYPKKQFVQGEAFLFQGINRYLTFRSSPRKRVDFAVDGGFLNALIPEEKFGSEGFEREEMQENLRARLLSFYQRQGRRVLEDRVHHWASLMQLHPTKLSFRSQKTRWGSCNSKGHVSLNWRLVAAPMEKLDYVVIHELAHLRHQNHSQRFWNLVESHCAEHLAHRKWLKDHMHEFDFLAKTSELHL